MANRQTQTLRLAIFLLTILPHLLTPLHAAEHPEQSGQQGEELPANFIGGHRFNPSFLILSPFSAPTVTTGMRIGSMHPRVTGLSDELDVVGFSPTVEGQIPIIRGLTIPLKVSGVVLAGTNAASALNYGATAGYRIETGLHYQVLASPRAALSGALTVAKPHLYSVSPLVSAQQAIREIVSGVPTDLNYVSQATLWYPSVRAAYTLSPTFGVQGSLGAQFFSGDEGESSHSQLALVLSFEAQLKPELNVPLALGIIYGRNQVLTQAGTQNSNTYAFSLFETISQRFNFGAEFGWIHVADNTVFSIGVLGRYYY